MTNEHFITLGKTPVPFQLEQDQDISIKVGSFNFTASVVSITYHSNQDSTSNVTYKLKFFANEDSIS